jgi:hypothetical protein
VPVLAHLDDTSASCRSSCCHPFARARVTNSSRHALTLGDAFRAAHSIWNLESDLNKFASPVERLRHPSLIEPAIDCREAIADPGEARSLLDSIRRMQIPAIPNDARMGLDGTAFEVTDTRCDVSRASRTVVGSAADRLGSRRTSGGRTHGTRAEGGGLTSSCS